MAENKRGFILYSDLKFVLDKLPDDKAGQLFKLILSYVNDENPTPSDVLLDLVFEPIKQQLKRDLKKWEHRQQVRSEAGKLGGLKSGQTRKKKAEKSTKNKLTTKQSQANEVIASNAKQNEANEAVNVSGNVNVNVSVNVNENYNTPREFLKLKMGYKLDELAMQKGFAPEEFELCLEQWSLKIEGSDFKYSEDESADYKKLLALFTKWCNSWQQNNKNRNDGRGKSKQLTREENTNDLRTLQQGALKYLKDRGDTNEQRTDAGSNKTE